MGWINKINRFFKEDNKSVDMSITDEFISIYDINFFGPCHKSSNNEYLVASMEGDWTSKKAGLVILILNDEIIFRTNPERPNDVKVANNGNFIVNDWLFTDSLKGIFFAFDKMGNVLIQKSFNANLHDNGISEDGNFAVCQTCNSNNEDSSILTIFDLTEKKVLSQFVPITGWAKDYNFDIINNRIHLLYNNGECYRYDLSGTLLDKEKWELKCGNTDNPFELRIIAEQKIEELEKKPDGDSIEKINNLLLKAIKCDLKNYPNEKAMIYRRLGEVCLILNREKQAIDYFEKAIKLYPKVGLKNKLNKLKQ